MTDKTTKLMPKELTVNQIITLITETVEKKGFTPQVAVFPLTSQERELAQRGDLTLGEYALWQTAQKAGVVTQPEKLKDTSERVRLLENPQVQAQIKSEKQGLESSLPPTPTLTPSPGPAKQDAGSKDGLPLTPVKAPNNPIIEKGKVQNEDKSKEQAKGGHPTQGNTKGLDKDKDSVNKQTEQLKEHDNVYTPVLAPIPTPENSKHDASQIYKIPERIDEGGKSDRSGQGNNDKSD